MGKDGTFYVLVSYSLANAIDASINEANKEEALYNEFKARQGFDALEKGGSRRGSAGAPPRT